MAPLSVPFPREASNDDRGGRMPLYAFDRPMALATFRSFVHLPT